MRVFIVVMILVITSSLKTKAQKYLLILSWDDQNIVALDLEDRSLPPIKLVENIIQPYDLTANQTDFYWSDTENRSIRKKDVNNDRLFQSFESNVQVPIDIEIDTVNRNTYWIDYARKAIFRKAFEGDRIDSIATDSLPVALAINTKDKTLYWIDYDTKTIKLKTSDSTEIQKLDLQDLDYPVRITVNYSDQKIYIADHSTHRIYRANYDGSKQELIYQGTEKERPFALYIDESEKKLYWTDYGLDKVRKSNLDGTEIEDVIDIAEPVGVVMITPDKKFSLQDLEILKAQSQTQAIQVYPNPASQYVDFYAKEKIQESATILIYDTSGKLIHQGTIIESPYRFDTKYLLNGVYVFKIKEGKNLFQGKFTIAR